MKTPVLTLVCLLFAAVAFAAPEQPADVLGLRWGMTAGEVNAVRPLSQDGSSAELYRAGTIRIGERDFKVILTIKAGGLEKVMIMAIRQGEPPSYNEFGNLVEALRARYKQTPRIRNTDMGPLSSVYRADWSLPRTELSLILGDESMWFTYTARPGHDVIDQL